jgi:hypothetical protein
MFLCAVQTAWQALSDHWQVLLSFSCDISDFDARFYIPRVGSRGAHLDVFGAAETVIIGHGPCGRCIFIEPKRNLRLE